MRSVGIIISTFLLLSTHLLAQVEQTKLQADQAYIEENYLQAVELYEQILTQEYVSAEVHYNLGNSYFKTGKIAQSVLNYERALKLAPNDEDIQFNLKLVNLSVKDKVEVIPQLFFVRWWNQLLHVFHTDGWAWNAVVALILALVGFLIFRFSSDEGIKRLTFYTALIAFLWTVFSVYAAQKGYNEFVNDKRAVVFASTINAKSAPDKKGKDLFVIHEGLVVEVSDYLNGWARIKLTNGNVGWVPSEAVVGI